MAEPERAAEGHRLVDASGIKDLVQHDDGCPGTDSELGCVCGLCPELKGLGLMMAAVLRAHGKETT